MANDLIVRILGDTKGLEKSFAKANQATAQFGRQMDGTTQKIDKGLKSFRGFATGTAVGFGGAVAFNELQKQISASIDVASNLNEQISRTRVVFGASAQEIEAWSKTTAEGIGLARDQALEAAGTFGAMFLQAGRSASDAAGLSEAVVTLASDLASFNNVDVADTLTALRSGLSGEIEPLRRFQVFLTEAAVSARAMADANKTNVKELTQGEKIMARWNLILEQTGKQQGDFNRTSESLANQQRILAANVRDLQAQIGGALLPAMESLTTVLNDATTGALALADALGAIGRIKIPTIVIPFTTKQIGGGTLGGTLGKVAGVAALGALSPAALATAGIVKLVKSFQDEPPPDTSAAAKAFDDRFDTFIESLEADVNQSVDRANNKLKAFGQKGFKPLETNELGKRLQEQFDATLASLDLQFDQAQFRGNQAAAFEALDEAEDVIRKRIATHGKTTALMRELLQIQQTRQGIIDANKDAARQNAQEAKDLAQAFQQEQRELKAAGAAAALAEVQRRQFRALGLSGTGDEIIPGTKNLATRVSGALKRIQSGELDVGSKVVDRLKLARNLLKKEGAKLTAETRSVINDLLNTLKDGSDELQSGPLTKTQSLNANKILQGLGLSPEAEREARARLSSFNTAGRALAGGGTRPTGGFVSSQPIVVENHNTVQLDGDTVTRNVTKSQQKQRRRNPVQKRGPNSGV